MRCDRSLNVGHEPLEYLARIADEGGVNLYVLVDSARSISMWILRGALGVSTQVAGDAVIKTHADGNEEVGFLYRVIDQASRACHHAEVEGIIGREAAMPRSVMATGLIAGADELFKGGASRRKP